MTLADLAKWHRQQADNERLKIYARKRHSWKSAGEHHLGRFHLAAAALCERADHSVNVDPSEFEI